MLMEHITFLPDVRAQFASQYPQSGNKRLLFIVRSRFEYIEAHFVFVSRILLTFKDKELEQLRDQADEMLRSSKQYHLVHLGVSPEKKK